ncbi:MAG: DUF1476 family protein [Alphaproteobacteria bacterium]|nr:DUF1476 family protein [Alphaproteobacteria bacterium]
MIDNLTKRERAHENKFAQDQEKIFKIRARRRKFIGLWAAQQMHLNEEESLTYALDIVKYGVGKRTVDEIAERILNDMRAKGVNVTLEQIQDKMMACYEKAIETLQTEGEL